MAEPSPKKFCSASEKKAHFVKTLIDPREIKRALMNNVKEPLVFHGYLVPREENSIARSVWKCLEWDAKTWGKLFGAKDLNFRIGERVDGSVVLSSPQWESKCLKGTMSYDEFLKWSEGGRNCCTSNGQEVDSSCFWAYFDYFYMRELEENKELEEVIDWGMFGFKGRGLKDSTLWIGTSGANTPCHIDTYGCNLVAQVMGKKRWTLFPKSQSRYLYPTRIPYEESSIYSQIGFPHPCLIAHPELCSTTPYVVTLEPGDVLYVPNQWWHFVENLEFSVSINTWLELPSDNAERVKEALVMYQVGSLCQGIESVDCIKSIFNPNMMSVASMTSSDLVQLLACKVFKEKEVCHSSVNVSLCDDCNSTDSGAHSEILGKKRFLDGKKDTETCSGIEKNHHLYSLNWDNPVWCADHGVQKVRKYTFQGYISSVLGSNMKSEYEKSLKHLSIEKNLNISPSKDHCQISGQNLSLEQLKILVDSFSDDRVIDLIKEVIDEKLRQLK